MTLEERQILVRMQVERARRFMSQADEMMTLGYCDMAVNRNCAYDITKEEAQALQEPTRQFVEKIIILIDGETNKDNIGYI